LIDLRINGADMNTLREQLADRTVVPPGSARHCGQCWRAHRCWL